MQPVDDHAVQRMFVGVPVPERARREIAGQLPDPVPGRLVDTSKWHFTLRFLGSVPRELRERFQASFAASRLGAPFDLTLEGLGAFPTSRRARILWVGTGRGRVALEKIAARVETIAVAAGFPAQDRRFSAHLTLSRIDPPKSVAATVAQGHRVHTTMRVEEIILYRSHLGGGPSRYEEIERVSLESV